MINQELEAIKVFCENHNDRVFNHISYDNVVYHMILKNLGIMGMI